VNKQELVASISDKTGFTRKDSERALNAFIESVEQELEKGERVQLVGFGTFEVRERKARKGRNPQRPNEVIDIPAGRVPTFKAGKGFKEIINK